MFHGLVFDTFTLLEVVLFSLAALIFGLFWGMHIEFKMQEKERERAAIEAAQQKMWGDYLNAVREGKNGR